MKFRNLRTLLLLFIPVFLLASCGTKRVVPITGRKIRVAEGAFSDGQMLAASKQAYPYLIAEYGYDSKNAQHSAMVKRVATNLINATTNYLRSNGFSNELKYYEWDFHLVNSKVPNAFCMPGGKIIVLEGILPVAGDETGLAAILGHEIGHAIAHHGAEKKTKEVKKKIWQTVGAVGVGVAGAITKANPNDIQTIINTGVGLSDEIMQFVEMRYSRKQELEADRIGMAIMAMAGYDPREAPKIWTRMTEMYGETPGSLLDSHPSNKKRRKEMEEKWMNEAMEYYRNSGKNKGGNKSNIAMKTGSTSSSSASYSSNSAKQYTVTASTLNVRKSPSGSSIKLGSLARGAVVTVTSISNGWGCISYNGKTGYVKMDYLKAR